MLTAKKAAAFVTGTMLVATLSAPVMASGSLMNVAQGIPSSIQTVSMASAERGGKPRLEEMAKERGMTVDQLRQEMKAKAQQRLEEKAKAEGKTVEQYVADKRAERLKKMAEEQGITVEQLKAKQKEQALDRMAKVAKNLGITAEEFAAKLGQ